MQTGGREASRGTVFTTNDEEHTVVSCRTGFIVCCSKTYGWPNQIMEAMIENGLLKGFHECFLYIYMLLLSHVQERE